MKDKKVIHLVDYINQNKEVKTSHNAEISSKKDLNQFLLFKRGVSFFVDLLVIGLLKTAIDGAYALFINQFLSPLNYNQKMELVQGNVFLHGLIFISIYSCYFLYTTFIFDGKTVGKKVMGLTVINENFYKNKNILDSSLNLKNVLNRTIGYVFCYLSFGTFFIFNFASEDKRGLSDYLSSSRTVTDGWLAKEMDKRSNEAEVITISIASLQIQEAA